MIGLPILLPEGFSSPLSPGDTVAIGQILAQRVRNTEEIINIAEEFGLPLHSAKTTLKKNPGDSVKNGDILALKKKFLCWKKEAIVSTVEGTVSRYEHDTGKLVIQTSYQSLTENILSPVDGTVAMCDNEKIVINTDKNLMVAELGSGRTGAGEIFILEESLNGESINLDNLHYSLSSEAIGRIIVGAKLPREVLMKGIGIGGAGVIGVDIGEEDLDHLIKKNISTPVLIVKHDILKRLIAWKGKRVFVDASSKSIIFLHT